MSNKVTLVATGVPNPNEMAAVQEYLQSLTPILMAAGGQLVKRMKVSKVLLGNPSGMVVIMDFDSQETIEDIFESQEYKALIPIRDLGFKELNILIASEM